VDTAQGSKQWLIIAQFGSASTSGGVPSRIVPRFIEGAVQRARKRGSV
jgi:hypothetical protein